MKKLVFNEKMQQIDKEAQLKYNISEMILMENAGLLAFSELLKERKEFKRILFVAGGGNNGADVLVMARIAQNYGYEKFSILLSGKNLSEMAIIHRSISKELKLKMVEVFAKGPKITKEELDLIEKADLIVDGLTGTGLNRELKSQTQELVKLINWQRKRGAFIVSIDMPSGFSDEVGGKFVHIEADLTLTMGLEKINAYHPNHRAAWGKIICINPSFPLELLKKKEADALLATKEDLKLIPIKEDSYKNQKGHLALFGGSLNYSGAAALASRAAFFSGVGLVSLFCDMEIYNALVKENPSIIVHPLKEQTIIKKEQINETYQAIAVGPGWSENREKQLEQLLESNTALVIDADGINALADLIKKGKFKSSETREFIITPHPGEFDRLAAALKIEQQITKSSIKEFVDTLNEVATKLNSLLVYKSNVTWIVDGKEKAVVIEGNNSSLAVAGSGDVLTGIIGSLLAQGYNLRDAAVNGVLIHKEAAIKAREALGWFDSSNLINYIGLVCREFAKEKV